MLLQAAFAAWRQVFSPAFRRILWWSLGLTVLLLALVFAALRWLFTHFLASNSLTAQYPVLDGYIVLLSSIGLIFLFIYLLPAITAVVASFFIDDAASIVEKSDFPADPPGKPAPLLHSIFYGLRFAGLSLLVNLVALALFMVPGVNLVAFFAANAYLLGREYFELAAMRFMPPAEAGEMRVRNRLAVFGAGALMSILMLVPIVNLLTPLFGIALMVHVHKRLDSENVYH